jgi:hypothetical protein
MSGGIDVVLDRLEGVRRNGAGRAMARCPAHEDKRASLSIREIGDGTVLLHCFSGCYPIDVCRAIGLEFRHLFPDRGAEYSRIRRVEEHERPRLSASDALAALDIELSVVCVLGAEFLSNKVILEDDWKRLALAVNRLRAARDVCCGPGRL